MKSIPRLYSFIVASVALGAHLQKRADPQGIDVSGYQGSVDFAAAKVNGISFAFIKATEGTSALLSPLSR